MGSARPRCAAFARRRIAKVFGWTPGVGYPQRPVLAPAESGRRPFFAIFSKTRAYFATGVAGMNSGGNFGSRNGALSIGSCFCHGKYPRPKFGRQPLGRWVGPAPQKNERGSLATHPARSAATFWHFFTPRAHRAGWAGARARLATREKSDFFGRTGRAICAELCGAGPVLQKTLNTPPVPTDGVPKLMCPSIKKINAPKERAV